MQAGSPLKELPARGERRYAVAAAAGGWKG